MSDQGNGQIREEQTRARTFNPNNHLIQLKSRDGSKDYLPVQWRLVWFREQCPHGAIEIEEIEVDLDREVEAEGFAWNAEKRRSEKIVKRARGYARYRATVTDGQGGKAMGTKSENAANFPDFIEKAETGAIGRALAALGYGTQFAPDLDEAHRIVDSPVDRTPASASENRNGYSNGTMASTRPGATSSASNGNGQTQTPGESTPTTTLESEAVVTEEQLNSIRKLCERLGKSTPENVTTLSYLAARKVIRELTAEYRELKQQNSKAS